MSHDSLLALYANTADVAVISVGYRLAPEDPFPKGPEDCYDAGTLGDLKWFASQG